MGIFMEYEMVKYILCILEYTCFDLVLLVGTLMI